MKNFTTISDQINILKNRKLIFLDEENAKRHLRRYGYYEIINGYKDCFLQQANPDLYKANITFEQIYALYELDKSLQSAVRDATLEFELLLKSAMSYVIAENFGDVESDYLDPKNYKTGKFKRIDTTTNNPIYALDEIISKFYKISNDNIEPFQHYRSTHGHIPPWILFKGATFGNMKIFFQLQKSNIKDEIISIILGVPVALIAGSKNTKELFSDMLDVSYKFRNRSAHSGRIFNYRPDSKVRFQNSFHTSINISSVDYRQGFGNNDIYTLNYLLKVIEASKPHFILTTVIDISLNNYLKKYPDDREFILDSMGVPKSITKNDIQDIFS